MATAARSLRMAEVVDWPAVQQRANEINSKLDAGQWDELGLGR